MKFIITPLTSEYREPVIDIFNYYVANSFAAYPEQPIPYEFFDTFLTMCKGYPAIVVKDETGAMLGFGMLRAYSPFPVFFQTAEITYFVKPGFIGKGIGTAMLKHLIEKAKELGITSILASISSLNEESIRFHRKNGFTECGRFRKIGRKRDTDFDVVYMQKMI